MDISQMKVVVFGGSGFIGSCLVQLLAARGATVVVPTRRFDTAKHLIMLPRVVVVETNVDDDAALRQLLHGADAAVNLVGILHSRRGSPYGPDFKRAHVDLPQRIVNACADVHVPRYLHMSALGAATDGPSMYQRSKAAGEIVARSQPSVAATIFRPSVVFGPGDKFLTVFARMSRLFPVLPLAGASASFQPVYVGDVAAAFANALADNKTRHLVFDLGGPNIYTLGEMVRLAGRYAGVERRVVELPAAMGKLQAMFFELLPGKPLMSRDNIDSMEIDNVVDPTIQAETARVLGIRLHALEAVAPRYLANHIRYDDFRAQAGR